MKDIFDLANEELIIDIEKSMKLAEDNDISAIASCYIYYLRKYYKREMNEDLILKYLNKAIKLKEPVAFIELANFYNNNSCLNNHLELAEQNFKLAIEHGEKQALIELGIFYIDNNRIEEAIKCCEEAFNHGYSEGLYRLGNYYYKKDDKKALEYYEKALEIDCFYKHSCLLEINALKKEAINTYLKRVENSDSNAMTELGFCYETGYGVETDEKEALKLYNEAIKLGNTQAMNFASIMYLTKKSEYYDYEKGKELCTKAAELGDSEACYTLARIYYKENNKELAFKYCKLALDKGNANVYSLLSALYLDKGDFENYIKCSIKGSTYGFI